jgi:hypothetical protein
MATKYDIDFKKMIVSLYQNGEYKIVCVNELKSY